MTEEERKQKTNTEDYAKRKIDIMVKCPACENNALLRRKILHNDELLETHHIIKRSLILRDLSCHYCGLLITKYDQLKLQFKDEEGSLPDLISHYDCPEDCDCGDCQEDCPEDCDCGDCQEDCPEDCDCGDCQEDCPEDCDCGDCQEDCPDDR